MFSFKSLAFCQHKKIQLKQITLQPSHISLQQEQAIAFACADCGELLGIDRTSELKRFLNKRIDEVQRGQADIRRDVKRIIDWILGRSKE